MRTIGPGSSQPSAAKLHETYDLSHLSVEKNPCRKPVRSAHGIRVRSADFVGRLRFSDAVNLLSGYRSRFDAPNPDAAG